MHDPIAAARGSATTLRFVADPRYLPNTTKRRTGPRTSKICNPCPPTFLLPISPAGHVTLCLPVWCLVPLGYLFELARCAVETADRFQVGNRTNRPRT